MHHFDSEFRFRTALSPTGGGDTASLRSPVESNLDAKDLYSGLIRLHILHHAVRGPVFGLGIIEELARHGYKVSAGTLYPILHGMERRGYLSSTAVRRGRHFRRIYRATPGGRSALRQAKGKVRELFGELFEKG